MAGTDKKNGNKAGKKASERPAAKKKAERLRDSSVESVVDRQFDKITEEAPLKQEHEAEEKQAAETVHSEEPEAKPLEKTVQEIIVSGKPSEMMTVIDKVVDYIKQKKRTTVNELSEALALERDQVEKLADVLEESGLITVRYSLLHPGKTELSIREKSGGQAKKIAEEGVKSADEMLDELDKDVKASEKKFLSVEDDILTRLMRAEETIKALEASEAGLPPEKLAALAREADEINGVLVDFDKKVDVLDRRIEAFRKRVAAFKASARGFKKRWFLSGFFERLARVFFRKAAGKG